MIVGVLRGARIRAILLLLRRLRQVPTQLLLVEVLALRQAHMHASTTILIVDCQHLCTIRLVLRLISLAAAPCVRSSERIRLASQTYLFRFTGSMPLRLFPELIRFTIESLCC